MPSYTCTELDMPVTKTTCMQEMTCPVNRGLYTSSLSIKLQNHPCLAPSSQLFLPLDPQKEALDDSRAPQELVLPPLLLCSRATPPFPSVSPLGFAICCTSSEFLEEDVKTLEKPVSTGCLSDQLSSLASAHQRLYAGPET